MLLIAPFLLFLSFAIDELLLVVAAYLAFHTLRFRDIEHGHDVQIVACTHVIGREEQRPVLVAFRGGRVLGMQPCPRILLGDAVWERDLAGHLANRNLVCRAEWLPLERDDVVIGGAYAMHGHGHVEFEAVSGRSFRNVPADFQSLIG